MNFSDLEKATVNVMLGYGQSTGTMGRHGMSAEAEGRGAGSLGLLGGMAEWSGSLVLQMGMSWETRVRVRALAEPVMRVCSEKHGWAEVQMNVPRSAWGRGAAEAARGGAGGLVSELPDWAQDAAGCVRMLAWHRGWVPAMGLEVAATVGGPEGCDLGSRAALRVATLRALVDLAGISVEGRELASWVRQGEPPGEGEPHGWVEFWAAAHGRAGHLLPVLCRPGVMEEWIALPPGVRVVAWPSGVEVGPRGDAWRRARTAAFMGKRLLEAALGHQAAYLTDISPEEYHMQQEHLPLAMPGEDYLEGWKTVEDRWSIVEPGQTYPVRAATAFAIHEHDRALRMLADLRQFAETGDEAPLWCMGGCLYASHDGYGAMGLGSPETDRMVEALRALPPEAGVLGARVSGGGTVAVLLRDRALPLLQGLAAELTPGQGLLE